MAHTDTCQMLEILLHLMGLRAQTNTREGLLGLLLLQGVSRVPTAQERVLQHKHLWCCISWRSWQVLPSDGMRARGEGWLLIGNPVLFPTHCVWNKGTLSVLIICHLEINEQMAGCRWDGYETS